MALVRIVLGASAYWSPTKPMAKTPFSRAASIPPCWARSRLGAMTSAPLAMWARAASFALPTSSQSPVYDIVASTFGLTHFAPSRNPAKASSMALNFWAVIRASLFVLVIMPAATPPRKATCQWLICIEAMLVPETFPFVTTNQVLGNFAATCLAAASNSPPCPKTTSNPRRAKSPMASAWSGWATFSTNATSAPSSFSIVLIPLCPSSFHALSVMTPGSTIATLSFLAWAALSVALPSKSTASPAISTVHVRFMIPPLLASYVESRHERLARCIRDRTAKWPAVPAMPRGPCAARDRRGESCRTPRHASLRGRRSECAAHGSVRLTRI